LEWCFRRVHSQFGQRGVIYTDLGGASVALALGNNNNVALARSGHLQRGRGHQQQFGLLFGD